MLSEDEMTSTNPFSTSGVNNVDAFSLPPGGGFVYENPFTDLVRQL